MKNLFSVFIAFIISSSLMAQAPNKISYQAVVRDAGNNLITNQTVGVRLSVLKGTMFGAETYVETHNVLTNNNGLISLELGMGTISFGIFENIDWSDGPYFIRTEIDPTGSINYSISGTSQLISVPFALHANTVDSIIGGVSARESDPIFISSIAQGISASDTANWNAHTIDTDTQLDSTGISGLGYVAGAHTIDTDTQLDSTGIAGVGYVAGAHTIDTDTQLDSTGISGLGYVAGAHTIDTDTQLDSIGISGLGYVAGAHTIDTDTQLDSTGISGLGYVAGAHTIDTDTQLDSMGISGLGYVAGAHTIDTDTQLDSIGISGLGYVAGAHTINTDTQLDSAGISGLGYVAGAHTIDTDTQLDSIGISGLGYVAGAHTINTDTQLDSSQIANLGFVAGAITTEIDGSISNELQVLSINNGTITLSNSGGGIQLPDSSVSNEIQMLSLSNDTIYLSDGGFIKLPTSGGINSSNTPVNGNLLTFDGTNWVSKNIVTGNTGSATAVNNMMPYITLSYCFCLNGIYPSRNSQNPFIAEIMTFSGNFAPRDWTFCDGQLLAINSYPAAYSLVGTIYGGNGITTFGIPDLRGRVGIHEGQGSGLTNRTLGSKGGTQTNTLIISNLPVHNHTIIIQ